MHKLMQIEFEYKKRGIIDRYLVIIGTSQIIAWFKTKSILFAFYT